MPSAAAFFAFFPASFNSAAEAVFGITPAAIVKDSIPAATIAAAFLICFLISSSFLFPFPALSVIPSTDSFYNHKSAQTQKSTQTKQAKLIYYICYLTIQTKRSQYNIAQMIHEIWCYLPILCINAI